MATKKEQSPVKSVLLKLGATTAELEKMNKDRLQTKLTHRLGKQGVPKDLNDAEKALVEGLGFTIPNGEHVEKEQLETPEPVQTEREDSSDASDVSDDADEKTVKRAFRLPGIEGKSEDRIESLTQEIADARNHKRVKDNPDDTRRWEPYDAPLDDGGTRQLPTVLQKKAAKKGAKTTKPKTAKVKSTKPAVKERKASGPRSPRISRYQEVMDKTIPAGKVVEFDDVVKALVKSAAFKDNQHPEINAKRIVYCAQIEPGKHDGNSKNYVNFQIKITKKVEGAKGKEKKVTYVQRVK